MTANSEQIKVLKQHFPGCFDRDGAFLPGKLQALVEENGGKVSAESYTLNWLGKSYARLLANEAPRTLLQADAAHNARPEHAASQNLLIQGDNLEVLKHLKGAYSRRVKMIYIDPPYNTGSDGFVYQDDRKFTPAQLSHLAGINEDEARRVLDFTSRKSNSHSAWLTFMYPRLYIARELLRDDGVIFISIDDNEQAQLKLLCDEVFGEENFITQFLWKKKQKPSFLHSNVGSMFEYVLCIARNRAAAPAFSVDVTTAGKKYPLNNAGNSLGVLRFPSGSVHFAQMTGSYQPQDMSKGNIVTRLLDRVDVANHTNVEPFRLEGEFRYGQTLLDEIIEAREKITISKAPFRPNHVKVGGEVKKMHNLLMVETYGVGTNEDGSAELESLFDVTPFSNPKPTSLIQVLCQAVTYENSEGIILDFFAGSGTTAHAVMQLNAKDGGNRQFICVQLDEATDSKSEGHKAGYNTIFDITRARISKAAARIRTEYPDYAGDLGFKVFQTVPVFDGYLDEPEELSANLELFNADTLTEQDRFNLLLTWAVQDGIALTEGLTPVELAGYTAYQGGEAGRLLYFIHPQLSLAVVIELLRRLDDDAGFAPKHLIVWGYGLDSKAQREMTEAVAHYTNRKSIELDLEVRF